MPEEPEEEIEINFDKIKNDFKGKKKEEKASSEVEKVEEELDEGIKKEEIKIKD